MVSNPSSASSFMTSLSTSSVSSSSLIVFPFWSTDSSACPEQLSHQSAHQDSGHPLLDPPPPGQFIFCPSSALCRGFRGVRGITQASFTAKPLAGDNSRGLKDVAALLTGGHIHGATDTGLLLLPPGNDVPEGQPLRSDWPRPVLDQANPFVFLS